MDAFLSRMEGKGLLGGILRKQCVQRCSREGIAIERCDQWILSITMALKKKEVQELDYFRRRRRFLKMDKLDVPAPRRCFPIQKKKNMNSNDESVYFVHERFMML